MTARLYTLPRLILAAALGLALTTVILVGSARSSDGGRPLAAELSGAKEVPGPADPDGTGTARLRLNQGQGEICYTIQTQNIGPAVAAHIHRGGPTEAGPVVVPLDTGLSGCVAVDGALVKEIRQSPEAFYVNVHTADFPKGAIRGQLHK